MIQNVGKGEYKLNNPQKKQYDATTLTDKTDTFLLLFSSNNN